MTAHIPQWLLQDAQPMSPMTKPRAQSAPQQPAHAQTQPTYATPQTPTLPARWQSFLQDQRQALTQADLWRTIETLDSAPGPTVTIAGQALILLCSNNYLGLATDPRLILLDEPFAGVDPIAVIDIQKIIRFLKEKGIGVLITDHNVRETLGICDRAFIINAGEVLASGRPDDIVRNEQVRQVYLGEHFRL